MVRGGLAGDATRHTITEGHPVRRVDQDGLSPGRPAQQVGQRGRQHGPDQIPTLAAMGARECANDTRGRAA